MLLYNTMIVYIFSCYRFCLVMGLLTFMLLTTNAQDRWRDHLPYHMGTYVTQVRNDFFCATKGGGLIIYKTDDNSIEKLSKANGLSDIGVSIIKYDNKTDLTLIAYLNGNIDILKTNEIINLPYIKNKDIVGKKTIHNIHFHDKKAYLACDFGIVVVDLIKLEIKEQYFIGEFGNQIKINAITTDKESIYAASEQGLYKASLASPNLIDYSQWSRINDIPDPTGEFSHIEYFAEKIFVVKADTLSEILFYDNNTWDNFRPSAYSGRNITFLDLTNGQMSLVTDNSQIDFYKASELNSPAFQYTKTNIQQGIKGTDNNYYIAVFRYGMVKTNGITENYFFPNGPVYKDAYRMDSEGDVVWVAAGSPGKILQSMGAYYFIDNIWHSFNQWIDPGLSGIGNLSYLIINPQNTSHVWFGSLLFGLVEVFDYQVKNHFTDLNSIFLPRPNLSPGAAVGISGFSYDINNNLWILANWTNPPLYAYSRSGKWYSFKMTDTRFDNIYQEYESLIITDAGDKWFLFTPHNTGLFIFNENNVETKEDNFERYVQIINQDSNTISRAFCMEKDKSEHIWIGTDAGPFVYYNPVLARDTTETLHGHQIKIPRNDGTGLADYLLGNETITAIEIDGANRKWFGTEKSGVYLFSEDGQKHLLHFHVDNSPLPSNNILDITISKTNGEVFFATSEGLFSFFGDATEPSEEFANVYAYPNPVRPDYDGDITILGLVEDCVVKITDISGNLVYEMMAIGGSAKWNGKTMNGRRVASGVYLIFLSNKEGTKTHITKLLFIN